MEQNDPFEKSTHTVNHREKKNANADGLLPATLLGAGVFWLVSFLTSLLPLAAQYRAAYSNWSPQTVWIGALFMGVLFSWCVAFLCLRRFRRILPDRPIWKALLIVTVLLLIALVLFDLPLMLRSPSSDLYCFFVGMLFNTMRFLLMGLAVGAVCRRRILAAQR